MYKDEVIHFIGGITEYVGELDQSEHPNGPGWYRINNPCYIHAQKEHGGVRIGLGRIWGVNRMYRKFVDLFCPPDSLVEIRVFDKEGGLYRSYLKELERPNLDRIVAPGSEDLQRIKRKH